MIVFPRVCDRQRRVAGTLGAVALLCVPMLAWPGAPTAAGLPGTPALAAATLPLGGINVEPAARPWRYGGANPDSWWCPTASECTTGNPFARIDTEMALARQLNVASVRLEIPWFLVEKTQGLPDWGRADYIFNSAAAHGVQIQPILVYTPAWAGGYNAFPPPAAFGAFVSAFMGRYGGAIGAVEMWNEPDGGQSLVANDPTQYVKDILIPGYTAVKASAHANVNVIEGGSINDSGICCAWLSGVYNAGGGNYFDIAAFHDYGGNYSQVVQAYQGVLAAHGQGGKPIWMGEYGASDATGSSQTPLVQSAMSTPGLAMAQFYTLRDEAVYTCCPPVQGEHQQYGLLTAAYAQKSSWTTMRNLLAGQLIPPIPPPTGPPIPGGYWLVASDGGIFPFGDAGGYGSAGNIRLNQPIVGMAATPDHRGYWLVASDGGVFPFGDAVGYGSTGNIRLNQPIVGMAATPDGHGYWLVASDGGIFPFGDAAGYGSTGGIRLNQPIIGMASTPTGNGYWLVASDGGIFPFGPGAGGFGSAGGIRLNQPIVGMAATHTGHGYWLVAFDGGIFPFGDAVQHSYGSTGGIRLNMPVVGMASTHSGNGYWLVASDGGIFPFGDAGGHGSTGNVRLNRPIVGLAASL